MLRYALTIFTSAFLLFQVQPIIGRFILPWFGGGPSIWTSCMLFFQAALLGGYLYSHLICAKLSVRSQAWVHLAVLAASVLLLPIAPDETWKPLPDQSPLARILLVLIATVGGPYFVLASTGPLMQKWFSQTSPDRSPYRLYALSNIGSLLALLSYPFVIEPRFTLQQQSVSWTSLYVVFACFAAWCAAGMLKHDAMPIQRDQVAEQPTVEPSLPQKPGWIVVFLWLILSACGSAMLLATTNQLCIDVATVPFLWILPLSLYLISFIICFDRPQWYDRRAFGLLLLVCGPLACWAISSGPDLELAKQVVIFSAALFACCMAVHGELVHSRPDPRYLTLFYLLISAGGVLGGLFVAILATNLFTGYWEFQISLVACCVFALMAACRQRAWDVAPSSDFWTWTGGAFATTVAAIAVLWQPHHESLDAIDEVAWLGGFGSLIFLGLIAVGTRSERSVSTWTWCGSAALPIGWLVAWGAWRMPDVMTAGLSLRFAAISMAAWAVALVALWGLRHFSEQRQSQLIRVAILAYAMILLALASEHDVVTRAQTWTLLLVGLGGMMAEWMIRKLRSSDRPSLGIWFGAPLLTLVAILGYDFWETLDSHSHAVVHRSRNFYGVLNVDYVPARDDDESPMPAKFRLEHGQIQHGFQYADDDWKRQPTTYYGRASGLGLAIETARARKQAGKQARAQADQSIHVGVVGLGTGTIAAYGEANDDFRFYEINPAVQELSGRFFTYLQDSAARTKVCIGDARIVMERELRENRRQHFDVLAIDAFSSDAIPVHLLTTECAEIYRRHLAADGILAIHISNRFLDLGPVVRGLADSLDWQSIRVSNDKDESTGVYSSTWVLLTENVEVAEQLRLSPAFEAWEKDDTILHWRDDYSGLWNLLSL
ncbi:spermidine synthase [Stieleria neptunia]|uniref:Spermidine synthase n=1 Tax=Stieleria neptunia TaxID=2527979 RepID=A0A518HHZ8_9BACT|nr:fused MFS/spermidine synthase [Stieleria neptunia]QDV40457.1 spermidine synthase [Stieleria neptunia]